SRQSVLVDPFTNERGSNRTIPVETSTGLVVSSYFANIRSDRQSRLRIQELVQYGRSGARNSDDKESRIRQGPVVGVQTAQCRHRSSSKPVRMEDRVGGLHGRRLRRKNVDESRQPVFPRQARYGAKLWGSQVELIDRQRRPQTAGRLRQASASANHEF